MRPSHKENKRILNSVGKYKIHKLRLQFAKTKKKLFSSHRTLHWYRGDKKIAQIPHFALADDEAVYLVQRRRISLKAVFFFFNIKIALAMTYH